MASNTDVVKTRSSAIAEWPRDAPCLANCHAAVQKLLIRQVLTKLMVWSWRFSRRQCVINNVKSTMTRPSRLPLSQLSWTNGRRSSCVYHLYTDDLLWRNFLSPQCRNCSRDPLREHSLITRLRLHMADPYTKSEVLALAVAEILRGVQNSKTGWPFAMVSL